MQNLEKNFGFFHLLSLLLNQIQHHTAPKYQGPRVHNTLHGGHFIWLLGGFILELHVPYPHVPPTTHRHLRVVSKAWSRHTSCLGQKSPIFSHLIFASRRDSNAAHLLTYSPSKYSRVRVRVSSKPLLIESPPHYDYDGVFVAVTAKTQEYFWKHPA